MLVRLEPLGNQVPDQGLLDDSDRLMWDRYVAVGAPEQFQWPWDEVRAHLSSKHRTQKKRKRRQDNKRNIERLERATRQHNDGQATDATERAESHARRKQKRADETGAGTGDERTQGTRHNMGTHIHLPHGSVHTETSTLHTEPNIMQQLTDEEAFSYMQAAFPNLFPCN